MTLRAVLLDFYGTLARATGWGETPETILAELGYDLDPALRRRWFDDGFDGQEHDEHSTSRDAYVEWRRTRTISMLLEADVHPDEVDAILDRMAKGATGRVMEAYDEVPGVLAKLRSRGLTLVVCSNWDWDLAEAVAESGLTESVDALVSSAWVGARKPHPRIFAAALAEAGVEPPDALYVGDTWVPDVEGPRAVGMLSAYLQRDDHWPDPGFPGGLAPVDSGDAHVITDLRGVLPIIG
ncbi:MAG: haloacid dehalogenase superfamily enzyme subfamily [Actinomycetia bacterium]|nr:haloacid dehalogenase superfamily enzyme subfamily [Actinomycetes bacterium]